MQNTLKLEHAAWRGNEEKSEASTLRYIAGKELLKKVLLSSRGLAGSFQPVQFLLQELKAMIRNAFTRAKTDLAPHEVADIYHRAVFICMAMGQYKYARDLCYCLIAIIIKKTRTGGRRDWLDHVFMPWISLVRIDRLEGNYHAAHKKINVLMARRQPSANSRQWLSQDICELMGNRLVLDYAVQSSLALERIMALLAAAHYQELISSVSRHTASGTDESHAACTEALIIALANSGRADEAFDLLEEAIIRHAGDAAGVFRLREFELRTVASAGKVDMYMARNNTDMAFRLLNRDGINSSRVALALHAVQVIRHGKLKDMAMQLAYQCLVAAGHCRDEILKAESLAQLYLMVEEAEGRKIIEDLMIDLYFNTQYVEARNKMIDVFADLKFVEIHDDADELNALYEYLQVFSTYM